jgi:hypothetical protein
LEDLFINDKRHQLMLISVIFFGAFMANIDGTIVNVSLPMIATEKDPAAKTILNNP